MAMLCCLPAPMKHPTVCHALERGRCYVRLRRNLAHRVRVKAIRECGGGFAERRSRPYGIAGCSWEQGGRSRTNGRGEHEDVMPGCSTRCDTAAKRGNRNAEGYSRNQIGSGARGKACVNA